MLRLQQPQMAMRKQSISREFRQFTLPQRGPGGSREWWWWLLRLMKEETSPRQRPLGGQCCFDGPRRMQPGSGSFGRLGAMGSQLRLVREFNLISNLERAILQNRAVQGVETVMNVRLEARPWTQSSARSCVFVPRVARIVFSE